MRARQYLNGTMTNEFIKKLNAYYESKAETPRIKAGKKQEIETLINEETYLFAKYLRNERKTWKLRIVTI